MIPRAPAPLLFLFLTACLAAPTPPRTPTPTLDPTAINLDSETQALIAAADRVAFIIPFSHWDTDWHETFDTYVKRSDGNILIAIQMADADPRFRYTLEQVYFVQHFWETFPEHRAALAAAIQRRQITFAWAGFTQPETSLVSPAIQVRNLQLGQQWIAETFGPEYVPPTAWQSDAFGNSAAFPLFLTHSNIPFLFIGRWQNRCDPDFQDCVPLPHLFYWQSPVDNSKVLVAYLSYPSAWDAIHRLETEDEQVTALRTYVEEQFARTDSKFAFIPMGSDFIDPLPNVVALVDRWNASDAETKLVIADPLTAFHYIETQNIPTHTVDLNPIWQAFYATRPFAKIADKELDYYLTAHDKFSTVLDTPPSAAWTNAAVSAHYDNIGAVSFDWVWEQSQRPRYEQALATAADDLGATLAALASNIDAPLIIFNPTSWERSEIVEINVADTEPNPAGQQISETSRAIQVAAVPAIGWATIPPNPHTPIHPVTVSQSNGLTTLANSLISVTLDSGRGGAITNLQSSNPLISSASDDITYWQDSGDVYGARFGDVIARESDAEAQITVLAEGPLLARVQIVFSLAGQTITKTVTLRADSPLVEIEVTLAALPNSSVIVHTHTNIDTTSRTDDLGFASFTHELDNTPIASGDITYRRKIFYPIMYWSDVADASGNGLALITHGLQALGGASDLNLLLVRDAREDHEGVIDTEPHTFRYAYLPHVGQVENLPQLAYAFNQPLIPVLKSDDQITIQLPFTTLRQFPSSPSSPLPLSFSLLSADSALIADLYRDGDQLNAVVIDYDPASPASIQTDSQTLAVPSLPLAIIPINQD